MGTEIKFEKLTPLTLNQAQKEKYGYANYRKVIDDAIASEDLCNIALTGAYGAGKSTIINTWLSEHGELKNIRVSLARFEDVPDGKTGGTEDDSIETKVINQIIHQIEPRLIPQTRFRRKDIVNLGRVAGCTALLFVLFATVLWLFRVPPAQWNKDSGITLYENFWMHKENIAMLAGAMLSSLVLLFCVVNAQYKRPIIKTIQVDKSQINLVGEMENGKSEEKFDRYMEEIIYLFQKSDIDILIIEDLDRFDGVEIFNELRQINFLLNQKRVGDKTCGRKKIKFIYLVKDELFHDCGERTKFFDIMIPIIPVMDHSNSYEMLKEVMAPEWQRIVDMDYLRTICFYVQDFRILKNIYNEFQLYYKQLKAKEHEMNATRLFAMITYKNIAPIDFAELQRRKGKVWRCLNAAERRRKERLETLDRQLEEIDRKAADAKTREEKELLRTQAEAVREQSAAYGEATLRELLQLLEQENVDTEALWEEFDEGERLIPVLIRDGKIAEGYASFMTYFYPNSISEEEYVYLNRVFERKADEAQKDIEISHPKLVLEHLKVSDFNSVAFPNKSLYRHLLESGNRVWLQRAVENLACHKNVNFMLEMYDTARTMVIDGWNGERKWTEVVLKYWKNLAQVFGELLEEEPGGMPGKIVNMLSALNDEDIKEGRFSELFAACGDELCTEYTEGEIGEMARAGYRVQSVLNLPEERRRFVYEHSIYRITKENIEYILQNYYKNISEREMAERNYASIMREKDAPLAAYILENQEYYLDEVYIPCYTKTSEETDILTKILNTESVQDEREDAVIDEMKVKIPDADDIEWDETLQKLLLCNKLAFTKENLLKVWENDKQVITEEMRTFLAENYKTARCGLSFVEMKKYFGETNEEHKTASKLCWQLLGIEEIDDDAFGNLVADINTRYLGLSSGSIKWSDEKMQQIIRTNTIGMTEKNLLTMRSLERDDWLYEWIEHQPERYFTLLEKEELREEKELQTLIARDGVVDTDKVRCIGFCMKPVAILEKYNTCVVEAIFAEELFDGNFTPVIRRYTGSRYSKAFMKKLREYMVSYIGDVLRLRIKIPQELLQYLLKDARVLDSDKKELISGQSGFYEKREVSVWLRLIGADVYCRAFEGERVRVSADRTEQKMIETFASLGWIASYRADGNEYEILPRWKAVQHKNRR